MPTSTVLTFLADITYIHAFHHHTSHPAVMYLSPTYVCHHLSFFLVRFILHHVVAYRRFHELVMTGNDLELKI